MSKQPKLPQRPAAKESPAIVLVVGIVCLVVGLATGYYFGRQSARQTATVASTQTDSTFVQNEAALRATVQNNPADLNALIQLGNLYYDHGQFRDAILWYGKALEIDPKNPDVRTDRGTSYWNTGQADAAIAEFRRALESDPSHAQTLYNLGVVYLDGKKDPAEARKAWERLLATNPNYPDRAKLQQQIASLAGPQPGAPAAAGRANTGASGMEDLLERMKSRKP